MSMMRMLTKVAVGFAVAKGMKAVTSGGGLGKMVEGLSGGGARQPGTGTQMGGTQMGGTQQAQTGGQGGLGGLLGGLTGGAGGAAQAGQGGLGGILGQLSGQGGAGGGGIGDMLGQLTGGKMNSEPGGLGGIGTLLGGLAGMRGGNQGQMESVLEQDMPTAEPEPESTAGLMIRAMLMAARADGKIDADEEKAIMGTIGDDASPDDMAFVQKAMGENVDAAAIARDTPKGMETQVYAMSVMSITPDNQAEAQYLHSLATSLGLEQQTANEIHDNFGVTRLYS